MTAEALGIGAAAPRRARRGAAPEGRGRQPLSADAKLWNVRNPWPKENLGNTCSTYLLTPLSIILVRVSTALRVTTLSDCFRSFAVNGAA